jgi:hypothetical protein
MAPHVKRRGLADSVGFAHREHQIEAVVQRIAAHDGARLERIFDDTRIAAADRRRMAIAPHDDFAYAGFMYPLVLRNVAAPVLIIFGVAHKAWQLGLENRLVFDSFTHWRGPYGDIAVSPFRERIMASLSDGRYCVHDDGSGRDGYACALAREQQILRDCFDGDLRPERIERFVRYTISDHDHREYQWMWCERYCVPFGLLAAWHLQQRMREPPLSGTVLGYTTSIAAH